MIQNVLAAIEDLKKTLALGLTEGPGGLPGAMITHKFGQAPDFDIADGFVNIWDGANDAGPDLMAYTFSTTAAIDSISSSSAADTVDIEITGLDSSYNKAVRTITLTGQTRVALDVPLIRVSRMKNVGATDLAGTVYCYEDTPLSAGVPVILTKTRAVITIGNNQTLMALDTVPAGKNGYLRSFYATIARKLPANAEVKLMIRPFGQVFQTKHAAGIQSTGTSARPHTFRDPVILTEKSDIMLICDTDTNGVSISGGFDLVFLDN